MNPRLESIFPPIDLDHEAEKRAQADVDGLLTELSAVNGELDRLRQQHSETKASVGSPFPDLGETGAAFVKELLAAGPDEARKAADVAHKSEENKRRAIEQADSKTRAILGALDDAIVEREQRARVLRDDLDGALSRLNTHLSRREYVAVYRPAALQMAAALAMMVELESLTGRAGIRANLNRIELVNPISGDSASYSDWRAPDEDTDPTPEIQHAKGEQHEAA